jgi:hypothetical protein
MSPLDFASLIKAARARQKLSQSQAAKWGTCPKNDCSNGSKA